MTRIIGIHGVGHQYQGEHSLNARWLPALKDGLALAGVRGIVDDDLRCAFYGDIYRQGGRFASPIVQRGHGIDTELLDPWEQEMLNLWLQAVGAEASCKPVPSRSQVVANHRAMPRFVQGILEQLSRSRFFAGVAENALIFNLKQVRLYLKDTGFREQIQTRVAKAVTPETRVSSAILLGQS